MSQVVEKVACPDCQSAGGDRSRNNLVMYSDGGEHCFACGFHKHGDCTEVHRVTSGTLPAEDWLSGEYKDLEGRGISASVCAHFDYEVGISRSGEEVQIANYYEDGELCGQKLRKSGKRFSNNGKVSSLFGQQLYAPSDKVFITVTEGEIDALSVAKLQGVGYPIVSIPNGVQGAVASFKRHIQYLKGFKHIVVCFDQDEPGKKAARDCTKLFDPGYCRIAKLPLKDVNEMLVAGRGKEVINCLFNAQSIRPKGVISFDEITVEQIFALFKPGIPICFPVLNRMLNGFQAQALYTLVARSKSGKTTVTKEIVSSLAKQGHKIGMLYLEEEPAKEITSFIAMEDKVPFHQYRSQIQALPEKEQWEKSEEIKDRLTRYNSQKNLTIYNHEGALDADAIYNAISYMVLCLDCKVIVLDNISISIAGTDVAVNERKVIDKIVFDLVKLINKTGCTILTVVHVNQKGEEGGKVTRKDVFGSGAFLKFSTALIGVNRVEDGTVLLNVLGNRTTGEEGDADKLLYNRATGRLEILGSVI